MKCLLLVIEAALGPVTHKVCAVGEKSYLNLRQCGLSSATLRLQPTDGRAKKNKEEIPFR